MSYTGINLGNVKNNNRSAILKLLNDQGQMSRKDIASALGLTPATVTVICSELIASRVLREMGEVQEERRAGRKKVLLGIDYDRYYVLSISIEAEYTVLTVSNMKGERCSSRRVRTDTAAAPEDFLLRVAEESKALMWESGVKREDMLGIGVSIPGIVVRSGGISTATYRIWEGPVDVRGCLQKALDLPVIVENNVKAFAEAEMIYGRGKELENLLFVKWGPGVGSSIVIHKQIYESRRFKAAEIGHQIVEKNGRKCRCGRRGCLETRVATHAIADQARSLCGEENTPQLWNWAEGDPSRITAHSIAGWSACEDSNLWKALEGVIDLMARSVSNTLTMLGPDQVIIYGQMFEIDRVRERFLDCCARYDSAYQGDYIILSRLGGQLDYIGPLAIVVNEIFLSGK